MFTELSTAWIIRACITPSDVDPADYKFHDYRFAFNHFYEVGS